MILKNKKGKLNMGLLNTVVLSIILITVLFQVYAEVIPEAQTGGDDLGDAARCADVGCHYNATGVSGDECQLNSTDISTCTASTQSIPLAGLFGSTGIVFTIIIAALLILVVKSSMGSK